MRITIPTCKDCPLQGQNCAFRQRLKADLAPVKGVKLTARITCPDYGKLYDIGDEVIIQIHEFYPGGYDPWDQMSWEVHSTAAGRIKVRPKRGKRFYIIDLNKPVTVDYPPYGKPVTLTYTQRAANKITRFMRNKIDPCEHCGSLDHVKKDCPKVWPF